MRSTHTVATLEVSAAAYKEIAQKLRDASYHHVFLDEGVIDMTGIGLTSTPQRQAGHFPSDWPERFKVYAIDIATPWADLDERDRRVCQDAAEWARQRVEEATASYAEATNAMQEDLAALLRALALGDHARSESAHTVMVDEVIPAVQRLVAQRGRRS